MINSINNFDTIDKYKNLESNINNLNKKANDKTFGKMLNKSNNDIFNHGTVDQNKLSKTQKKLFDSCVDMESFFWKQLLNEMKKTINKYKLIDGGQAEEIFSDMLYDEYSKMMAKNANTNIATDMFKQLYKNI